jgi:hypothetical protein
MPSRFTEQTVEELKRHRLRWAGQYQQPPKVIIRAQSLDEPMTSGSRGRLKHARSIAEFHIASLEGMSALLVMPTAATPSLLNSLTLILRSSRRYSNVRR